MKEKLRKHFTFQHYDTFMKRRDAERVTMHNLDVWINITLVAIAISWSVTLIVVVVMHISP